MSLLKSKVNVLKPKSEVSQRLHQTNFSFLCHISRLFVPLDFLAFLFLFYLSFFFAKHIKLFMPHWSGIEQKWIAAKVKKTFYKKISLLIVAPINRDQCSTWPSTSNRSIAQWSILIGRGVTKLFQWIDIFLFNIFFASWKITLAICGRASLSIFRCTNNIVLLKFREDQLFIKAFIKLVLVKTFEGKNICTTFICKIFTGIWKSCSFLRMKHS